MLGVRGNVLLCPQQSSSQFMRHAKRRKLTVEDFNRALRWSNVEVACNFHIRSPSGDSMSDVTGTPCSCFCLCSLPGHLRLWSPGCAAFPFSERRRALLC